MACLAHLYVEGFSQHIIQRGNNRQACFFADEDYKFYLDKLHKASKKYRVSIHAFVLMTNHVHILATPSDAKGTSLMMQSVGRSYVGYVNHQYGRTGTLWEGRYKSTLVDSESYLLIVSRYIELNPVRAAMVDHAAEYPWSSYQYNAVGKPIKLITPHELYVQLGKTPEQRQTYYRSLFDSHMPQHTLDKIRQSTNKAWVLGDVHFREQVESVTGRSASPRQRGGDRKSETCWNGVLEQFDSV